MEDLIVERDRIWPDDAETLTLMHEQLDATQ